MHTSTFSFTFFSFSHILILVALVSSIIAVTTQSAILSNPDMQRDKLGAKRPGAAVVRAVKSSGWLWGILKVFFVLGVLAGVLYGYKMWVLGQAGRGAGRGLAMGGMGMGINTRAKVFGGGLYDDGKRF